MFLQRNHNATKGDDTKLTQLDNFTKNTDYENIKTLDDMRKKYDDTNYLYIAAANGNLDLCKTLIKEYNFDKNMTDNNGYTAIHHSVAAGNYDLLKFFVDVGADINVTTKLGHNCLHIAALKGHLELCNTLIDNYKFDKDKVGNYGCTALHHSAESGNYELFKFFVDKGANIKLKTIAGESCLHIAAFNGQLDFCKTLIKVYQFDKDMSDNNGCTALHHSAGSGVYDLVQFFVNKRPDLYLKNKFGHNCLHIAAFYGHLNLCKKLIERSMCDKDMTDNDGCTALHHAAGSGMYGIVKFFVDKGAEIHLKNKLGQNCLHAAALHGHLNLCKTFIDTYGFDKNIADNNGWTALHNSAQSGSYELVKFFVEKGAEIHQKTKAGESCLHIAARNGHLNLCQTLIANHGFDKNIANNNGWTALHSSARSGSYELVIFFVEKGADIHQKTKVGENCLHIAARNGHLNLCQTLIANHGFDKNIANNNGWTALHSSAQSGSYELVIFFVEKGADIHQKTKVGENCLHIAARNGHLNLCQNLIAGHGFDKNIADNDGLTALLNSAQSGSYELVKFFVEKGADVHETTKAGENCLHIAARNGHLNLCQTLIDDHGFDKNIADNNGWTALHNSAQSGSYELVKFFVEKGADIYEKTKADENCLHIAARNGHLNLCQNLIDDHGFDKNIADNNGVTALLNSAQSGSYELVKFFVEKGADIHEKTKAGYNCLHIAAGNGHLNLCQTLIDDHGFDKNIAGKNGWTALLNSVQNGSYELVKFFVEKGADIHEKTKAGYNCLHIAAGNGHLNLCQTLIDDHGFDKNIADKNGWTALLHSAQSGSYELVTFFVEKGADVHEKTKAGYNCLHIAACHRHLNLCQTLIDDHGFDKNIADNNGWTKLHISAQSGSYELVKFFVEKGADIYEKTKADENCLHIAARNGHLNLCQTLIDDHGFDKNIADNNGWTALHNSAQSGSYELVKFFVEKGADIYEKTKADENCLHIAARNGHLNLCQTLIDDHGFDKNIADNNGWTALLNSAQSGSYELVKFFVEKGADIQEKTKAGEIADCLHIAARNGHLELCQTLIDDHGFDKNIADNNGWTALLHSAQSGSYELVKFFVEKGADVHETTKAGKNCLHIAARSGHLNLCQTLIADHGFDKNIADNDGLTALLNSVQSGSYELVKFFVEKGADVHETTKAGENCLHIAACNGHLNLCQTLIADHGFDKNIADNNGWTALLNSVQSGSYELVKFFVEKGADIHEKTRSW